MLKITKTEFKKIHEAGKLKLLCGMVKKSKEEVLERINAVRHEIEKYCIPTSNHGYLESAKDGSKTINIYRSDCEDFIFIETIIDNSKNRSCSTNEVEIFTTTYLAC